MNEILSNYSDPSKFATDESFLPKATIPRKSHDVEKLEQERLLEEKRKQEELILFNSTEHQKELRLLRQKQKRTLENETNAEFGSLFVRFVRARLQHLKLHVLHKMLGVFVSDKELSTADQFMFSVEQETSEMRRDDMIPMDIAAVDEAFQSILLDMAKRIQDEKKHSSEKFAADTWYGALCHQVDDHAKLLVDFRRLQNENTKLERERDEYKETVTKKLAEQESVSKRNFEEKQARKAKTEMQQGKPSGRTATLTLELAMRDAEKRGESNNNNKKNSLATTDEESSQQNADVAKSLRLQDELTVLRKSSHTLQLSLARVQHRYSLLLKEHEELKSEIRNVIAQQDAEETDIRRIFVERERDFDVATKKIQNLERELQTTSRKLDLAKSMRTTSRPSLPGGGDDDDDLSRSGKNKMNASAISINNASVTMNNENNNITGSLADRMTKLRGDTVGKMQVAFAPASAQDDSPSHKQNENQNNVKANENHMISNLQKVLKTEFTGINAANNNNDDEIFDEETPQDVIHSERKKIANNNNNNITRNEKKTTRKLNQKNDEEMYVSDVGTMTTELFTDDTKQKRPLLQQQQLPTTVGTQTFFRNSASSSLASLQQQQQRKVTNGGSNNTAVEHSLQFALDEQILKNQQQEKYLIDMEVKLDKIVRTVNKQCNVVEKFLDEQFMPNNNNHHQSKTNNVIFLKQDLQNLLKRFGIPIQNNASEPSFSNASKNVVLSGNKTTFQPGICFQQILFRAPVFSSNSSPILDPSYQDEEKFEKVLDQIELAIQEARRLERMSDQSCQTTEDIMHSHSFFINASTVVIDAEGGEHDPLLAHLKKTSAMNNHSATKNMSHQHNHAKDVISPPSSFWNATEAVNALKRVYEDAGRLIDSVETEAEVMMKFDQDEFKDNDDDDDENNIEAAAAHPSMSDLMNKKRKTGDPSTENHSTPKTTSRGSSHHKTPQQIQQELNLRQQQRNKQQQENFEQIATEQFFAIRSLESSCKLLVQRLGYAKEDYVKRFYDRSSLLHQTLGNVSRTHPREANKLSRLAKTVQQARCVVPWMSGVASKNFSDFCANNNNNNEYVSSSPASFLPREEGNNNSSAFTPSSTPPLQFKASEIVMGRSASSPFAKTSGATPTTRMPPNCARPSSAASPGVNSNNIDNNNTNNNNNNNNNNIDNNNNLARRVL